MSDFATFWKTFPRKVGKLDAMKAWEKAIKISPPEEIIAGVPSYIANKPDYADYCHPATWLNKGRWMDEYENENKVDESRFRRPTKEECRLYRIDYPWETSDPEWIPMGWQPKIRLVK